MIVPDYVAPIIALMAAAVVTLILVLPVAALVTIADRILALPVAALVNMAGPFFKGLFCREATENRTPWVDHTAVRSAAPAPQGVPDYIAPIVGYRAWQWDGTYLKSLNGETWYPGRPITAKCGIAEKLGVKLTSISVHQPAVAHCSCGIYAAKTLDDLRRMGYFPAVLYGEVYLWGLVVEHKYGWRAQFAYPKTLTFHVDLRWMGQYAYPATLALAMWQFEHLERLTAYGADIYVAARGKETLLWTKQFGYTEHGRMRVIELPPSSTEARWFT